MDKTEQEILHRHLSRFLASEFFDTITEDDILKQDAGGRWTHRGNVLQPTMMGLLSKEATAFSKMGLFKILCDEMLWHAKSKHNKATTEQDLITANILAYLIDVLQSKVKKIAEIKKTP